VANGNKNGMWRNDIDEKELIRLYTIENLSINSIQKLTGIDRGVITRRLKNNNIEIVKKDRSDKSKDNTPAKNKLFYKYRMQAKRRNIIFNLKQKEFLQIINKSCFYCGKEASNKEITSSGHVLSYNGIDRIDNTRGYELDNIVPCCKFCNKMKNDLSYDMFINQIKSIYEYQVKL
jgi:hypothetical protein